MSEKVTDIDAGRPHLACVALCSVCAHEWAAVLPESAEKLPLECPECHQMSGQIEQVPFINFAAFVRKHLPNETAH